MNIQTELAIAGELIASLPDVIDSAPIGSATYIDEPQDVDIALLVKGGMNTVLEYGANYLLDKDFLFCSEDYTQVDNALSWTSLRRGKINLMITTSRKFFDNYKTATEVCKALNLTDKNDRIKVCRIVRDGKKASEV